MSGRAQTGMDGAGSAELQEALRESEENYRAIFELASDAMFVHDSETGAIVDANRQACELLGCSREELQGSGLLRLSPDEAPYDTDHAWELIQKAAGGEPQRFEWLTRRCGAPFWVEVKLDRITISGRGRVLGSVRDITERKETENALRRTRDEFERAVEERTSALAAEVAERREAQRELQRREEHFRLLIENSSDVASILDAEGINRYTEDQLRFQKALLEAQGEASIDGILMVSSTGEILSCNRRLAEMWGIPPAALDEPTADAVLEHFRDQVEDPHGFMERVRFLYDHPDEESRDELRLRDGRVLDRYSGPVRSPEGMCYGRIWFFRDVTERLEAEEARRRSEQRFRSVVENASDLVTILDGEGIILYQSPAIERTYGYAQDELVGLSCFEYVHPDDVPAVIPRLVDVVTHPGQVRSAEFRFRHKDGHWIHIEAVGTTLSPSGSEDGVIINSRDITERKRTELRLQETTRFLENLIASSPGVIFRGSGESFQTTYISPNAETVLGYTAEQFLAEPHLWVDRTHPEDREEVSGKLVRAMAAAERQLAYEYRFLHSDGAYRNLLASVRFERDSSTGEVEVLGYTLDVSRLKEAEAALRAAKEEAEEAREIAERANRAKSEFLSRMSHELRTPMNSILGFAQILAKRDLPPDQAKGIDHIIRAGRHLLNLINEVLDLARIESDHDTLSLEPVHAASLLADAISMMRPTAAQQDCRLDDTIPSEADRYVRADRQRLTQVVLNLLSNAIKFNRPNGSVSLICEVGDDGEGGGRLAIGVRDTGVGIPPERRDELFLPFSRLEADRAGIEGTGLGLTLCRRLVEAMDGRIQVESAVAEGSTFWIELPITDSPLTSAIRGSQGTGESRPETAVVEAATILYIEDNLANLSLVETIFDDRPGIQLIPALQGRLGLELARQHAPNLILLDLHLPDLPGEEVLRVLRREPATRYTPVVVISADATPRQIANLREAGAQEYLTKPLDIDRFRQVVDDLLATASPAPDPSR